MSTVQMLHQGGVVQHHAAEGRGEKKKEREREREMRRGKCI
jgi:hypothetical protein